MPTCKHASILFAASAVLPAVAQPVLDWRPARQLTSRNSHAMACDSVRQRIVLFGGGAHRPYQDTWEWNGTAWSQRSVALHPPFNNGHAMAFDESRGRIVLAGNDMSSTWEWDGAEWHQSTHALRPEFRRHHTLTYDSLRRRVVLFGGQGTGAHDFADTWEYDGTAWTRLAPAVSPPARAQHVAAFDGRRGVLVLFGGGSGLTAMSDTWEWNGTTWSRSNPTVSPPARAGAAMAFDPVRQRIVLYGGGSPTGPLTDTWEYDGRSWVDMTSASNPGVRVSAAMAWDAARGRCLLFGGTHDDTWEWDGSNWRMLTGASVPTRVWYTAMTYDAARRQAVRFGGSEDPYRIAMNGETWLLRGQSWSRAAVTVSPPSRTDHAMAYDPIRQRVVLFGGRASQNQAAPLGDTWEFDGITWQLRHNGLPGPSARAHAAMTFNGITGRVLLLAGTDAALQTPSDMWEWDGGVWTQVTPAVMPPPRIEPALAYDPLRRRVVLYGGAGWRDTWEWDGASWQQFSPQRPLPGSSTAMTYDPRTAVCVLVSSWDPGVVWSWDGSAWSQRRPPSMPLDLSGLHLAHDTARGALVAHEGFGTTWFYGPGLAAQAQPLRPGCAGAGVVPRLTSGTPYFNHGGVPLDLLHTQPNAPCVIALAHNPQNLIIGGCTLQVGNPMAAIPLVTSAAGFATVAVRLPFTPSLRGTSLFAQGFVFAPPAPVGGWAFSNGWVMQIGD
jgi:hypothetical protein